MTIVVLTFTYSSRHNIFKNYILRFGYNGCKMSYKHCHNKFPSLDIILTFSVFRKSYVIITFWAITIKSDTQLCFLCNWVCCTWWRHQMETFAALLAICAGNSPAPHKGQWRGVLMFSLICTWITDWVNNREAGDLRRHRAHHDVIVMSDPASFHAFLDLWLNLDDTVIENYVLSDFLFVTWRNHYVLKHEERVVLNFCIRIYPKFVDRQHRETERIQLRFLKKWPNYGQYNCHQ